MEKKEPLPETGEAFFLDTDIRECAQILTDYLRKSEHISANLRPNLNFYTFTTQTISMKYLSTLILLLISFSSYSNDTLQTESGLRYYYVHYGNGEAVKDGWVVIAHYDGRFLDGSPFDSSRERGQPFAFNYNRGQVIKGMDEAVGMMKVGDRMVFIIPSELAYGEDGAGEIIPPNADLVFDVQIMDQKERSLYQVLAESLTNEADTTLDTKAMIKEYKTLKKEGFGELYTTEGDLNRLGYMVMSQSPKDAIKVFQLNVDAYPESGNVYDSLGEAYMESGNNKKAIENYKRSLEKDPENENAKKMIAKMEENGEAEAE